MTEALSIMMRAVVALGRNRQSHEASPDGWAETWVTYECLICGAESEGKAIKHYEGCVVPDAQRWLEKHNSIGG